MHDLRLAPDRDPQRPAEELDLVPQLELGLALFLTERDGADVEVARVEPQLLRPREVLDLQRHAPVKLLAVEVDGQVQDHPLDPDLVGARERMGVGAALVDTLDRRPARGAGESEHREQCRQPDP